MGEVRNFSVNSNAEHLRSAASQCDNVLIEVARVVPVETGDEGDGLYGSIVSYREAVAHHLSALATEKERLGNQLAALEQRARETEQEVQSQKGRLEKVSLA
jgi:hypothetical protein